jgi:putative sigma-54 modulation protein
MNIVINGRNVDVSGSLRKYAEDKIGRFDKYLPGITEATVTLGVQRHIHKAEVLLKANGAMIQAVGNTGDFFSAIDEVADKLDRQVKKHKEKLSSQRKSEAVKARGRKAAAKAAAPPPEAGLIIKRKRNEMKPMTPEEAAVQLDISGGSFFVFMNDQSGQVNVIYRLADGNLGLIEPKAS